MSAGAAGTTSRPPFVDIRSTASSTVPLKKLMPRIFSVEDMNPNHLTLNVQASTFNQIRSSREPKIFTNCEAIRSLRAHPIFFAGLAYYSWHAVVDRPAATITIVDREIIVPKLI